MSEDPVSPRLKMDKKSSIKKSSKPDQSKSKKKPVDFIDSPMPQGDNVLQETAPVEVAEPKPISKSSKRELMQLKAESTLKEHMKQAEKSEKSAKMMKSTDKASTIKENHNHVESNQREFSVSKQPDQALDVSKKKMATESKKNKVQETNTKHPKTEQKTQNKELEPQAIELANKHIIEVAHQGEVSQKEATIEQVVLVEIKPENQENKKDKGNTNSKKSVSIAKDSKEKESKFSKKRPEPARSTRKTEQPAKDEKSGKSAKKLSKSAAKSAAKSKDSRTPQGKSGVKKLKQNEKA